MSTGAHGGVVHDYICLNRRSFHLLKDLQTFLPLPCPLAHTHGGCVGEDGEFGGDAFSLLRVARHLRTQV